MEELAPGAVLALMPDVKAYAMTPAAEERAVTRCVPVFRIGPKRAQANSESLPRVPPALAWPTTRPEPQGR